MTRLKNNTRIALFLNLFIGTMSFFAWIYMAFFTRDVDNLTSSGFTSLKYFTVLSNLFNGLAAFSYSYHILTKKKNAHFGKTLKLAAASSVGLTFVTVLIFLGPLYGYDHMFLGGNMWMHLILPIVTFISFIFFEDNKIPFKNTFYCIVPAFIYAIFYLGNIFINGIGEWPNRNDFYSFLNWGYAIGGLIAIIILFITWLNSLILRKLENMYLSRRNAKNHKH